jgi:hypothetical protein
VFRLGSGKWREKRDSNPQLTVLETVALPIELFSLGTGTGTTCPLVWVYPSGVPLPYDRCSGSGCKMGFQAKG